MGGAFKSFLVGLTKTTTTIEAMTLIETLAEELLDSGLRGGVGAL